MKRREKPDWQQEIAKERIEILFKEALAQAKAGRLDRATRYVFIARKLAMKYQVRIPKVLRRKFCHKCYQYLLPGKNVSVRTNPKTRAVEMTCKNCKHINRYPYSKQSNKKEW